MNGGRPLALFYARSSPPRPICLLIYLFILWPDGSSKGRQLADFYLPSEGSGAPLVTLLLAVIGLVITATLLGLERRGHVELEWNPFSEASKGARAERQGAVGEALWHYDRAGQSTHIIACLYRRLPDSPLRVALLETTAELLDFKHAFAALDSLSTVDLGNLTDHIGDFGRDMSVALWQTAERVAGSSALWGSVDISGEAGSKTLERLREIRSAIRRVRNELAGFLVSGTDQGGLEMALSRSTALADTIHALNGPTQ